MNRRGEVIGGVGGAKCTADGHILTSGAIARKIPGKRDVSGTDVRGQVACTAAGSALEVTDSNTVEERVIRPRKVCGQFPGGGGDAGCLSGDGVGNDDDLRTASRGRPLYAHRTADGQYDGTASEALIIKFPLAPKRIDTHLDGNVRQRARSTHRIKLRDGERARTVTAERPLDVWPMRLNQARPGGCHRPTRPRQQNTEHADSRQ